MTDFYAKLHTKTNILVEEMVPIEITVWGERVTGISSLYLPHPIGVSSPKLGKQE